MGTLVKEWLAARHLDRRCVSFLSVSCWTEGEISPDEIYRVTVMSCCDKKLEALRSDFYNEQYATRDVD